MLSDEYKIKVKKLVESYDIDAYYNMYEMFSKKLGFKQYNIDNMKGLIDMLLSLMVVSKLD